MKNIHLLPTDKPSRLLYFGTSKKLTLQVNPATFKVFERNTQNIYITNSEEIEKGDWVFNFEYDYIVQYDSKKHDNKFWYKKIILTTDQDLIKDGVQAIDDTFLEWFVKNLNCESIEVCKNPFYEESNYEHYKIIIPQEEPKQLNPKDFGLPIFGTKEFNNLCSKFMGGKPKQETLEEAAENYASKKLQRPITIYNPLESNVAEYVGFIEGAKFQAKKMYNEEEVYKLLLKHQSDYRSYVRNSYPLTWSFNIKDWFEQFKKK